MPCQIEDRCKAITWLMLAAAQGDWQSPYDLGNVPAGMGAKKSVSDVRIPGPDAQAAVARLSMPAKP
ncbi:MAG: hypothetical protein V4582_16770 [Pseudomonadota bacterium]